MKLETRYLNSEDVTASRKEVDKVYRIYKEGLLFTKRDFEKALKKASRRIDKTKSSPKSS